MECKKTGNICKRLLSHNPKSELTEIPNSSASHLHENPMHCCESCFKTVVNPLQHAVHGCYLKTLTWEFKPIIFALRRLCKVTNYQKAMAALRIRLILDLS